MSEQETELSEEDTELSEDEIQQIKEAIQQTKEFNLQRFREIDDAQAEELHRRRLSENDKKRDTYLLVTTDLWGDVHLRFELLRLESTIRSVPTDFRHLPKRLGPGYVAGIGPQQRITARHRDQLLDNRFIPI